MADILLTSSTAKENTSQTAEGDYENLLCRCHLAFVWRWGVVCFVVFWLVFVFGMIFLMVCRSFMFFVSLVFFSRVWDCEHLG